MFFPFCFLETSSVPPKKKEVTWMDTFLFLFLHFVCAMHKKSPFFYFFCSCLVRNSLRFVNLFRSFCFELSLSLSLHNPFESKGWNKKWPNHRLLNRAARLNEPTKVVHRRNHVANVNLPKVKSRGVGRWSDGSEKPAPHWPLPLALAWWVMLRTIPQTLIGQMPPFRTLRLFVEQWANQTNKRTTDNSLPSQECSQTF